MGLLREDSERPRRDPAAGLALRVGDWSLLGEAARAVRLAVFVDEQGIDPKLELDELDAGAVHAVAYDAQGTAIATGRLLPDARIGRMAVLARARNRGVGAAILRALVAIAAARGDREVVLHAQRSAARFYAREGFREHGGEYLEAGIAHVTMTRALADAGAPAPRPDPQASE
jgi:hypothetical protein